MHITATNQQFCCVFEERIYRQPLEIFIVSRPDVSATSVSMSTWSIACDDRLFVLDATAPSGPGGPHSRYFNWLEEIDF